MDIRAATVQDADAVQRLRKHAWRARYAHPQTGVTREVLETELAVLPPTSAELAHYSSMLGDPRNAGRNLVALVDGRLAGTVTYGPNLQAWAVFLLVVHHVPVERCAAILESLSGIRPSDGFVHALLARAARAVRFANILIRALIVIAGVVCADETPIRVGPGPKTRKRYLLVACTNLLTCYFLGDRTLASFDGFVFPDLSGSTAVHDRYQN